MAYNWPTFMTQLLTFSDPRISVAVRTLLLSGFTITNNRRRATHSELECTAPLLGNQIPVLIVLTEDDELAPQVRDQVEEVARRAGRTLVVVATSGGEDHYSWDDFMGIFGGEVPTWRALTDDYSIQLEAASSNQVPAGYEGEAWRLFEMLVADGLEFSFGRKVRRLGASKRGQRVSDMITQLPDDDLVVVDAKATGTVFNAAMHELRPLAEYVKNQRIRQRGSFAVFGALIVTKAFSQSAPGLASISGEFIAETGVPAAFLQSDDLLYFVNSLRTQPGIRSSLRWKRILSGGLVKRSAFDMEVSAAQGERL
jgi:hypothetical protein